MRQIVEIVSNFLLDRKTMLENNSDPQRMYELLLEELKEVFEVLDDPTGS